MDAVTAAFAYFSIVPVPRVAAPPGPGALAALPLVGACLGCLAGLAGVGAARILPAPLGAIVALAALAILTGAIHLDGFLDGCDAFFASVSPDRRRDILKDPRHGTFAVVGFAIVVSLAGAALAALPAAIYPLLLALVCAAARLGAVAGAFVFPGAGAPDAGPHFRPSPAIVVALGIEYVAIAAAGFALSPILAVAVPTIAVIAGLACEAWIRTRIGGLAGDAYGFAIAILEMLGLLAFAGVLTPRA